MDTKTHPDSDGYKAHMENARSLNLNDVDRCGSVQVFFDEEAQHPVITFIPRLALDQLKGQTEDEIVKKLMLFFIRTVDSVVQDSYSLVYCHTSVNILSQRSLITEYYSIMPRRYKKNLKRLFVLHPAFGIRMFFEFTRVFLSSKFYSKLVYVPNILALQQVFPPSLADVLKRKSVNSKSSSSSSNDSNNSDNTAPAMPRCLRLPSILHYWEDTQLLGYVEHRGDESKFLHTADLKDLFVPALGAPYLLYRCVEYIRAATNASAAGSASGGKAPAGTGMLREGLFRVAGDHTILSLVRLRLQRHYELTHGTGAQKLFVSANPLMGSIDIVDGTVHPTVAATAAAANRQKAAGADAPGSPKVAVKCVPGQYDNQYILIGDHDSSGTKQPHSSSPGATGSGSGKSSSWEGSDSPASSPTPSSTGHSSASSAPMSSIVITDVDSVAQVIKLCVGDLPNPLIVYDAYDEAMKLTKKFLHAPALTIPAADGGSAPTGSASSSSSPPTKTEDGNPIATPAALQWFAAIDALLGKHMPKEHTATLNYLLSFLADVSALSHRNKMSADNLAIIFAPIALRATNYSADPMLMLGDLNACKMFMKMLILRAADRKNKDAGGDGDGEEGEEASALPPRTTSPSPATGRGASNRSFRFSSRGGGAGATAADSAVMSGLASGALTDDDVRNMLQSMETPSSDSPAAGTTTTNAAVVAGGAESGSGAPATGKTRMNLNVRRGGGGAAAAAATSESFEL